ncbi:hypothetical protein Unana1_03537 [Umbelopsis nana]
MAENSPKQCAETNDGSQFLQNTNSVADSIVASPTEDIQDVEDSTETRGIPAGCVFVASLSKLLKDSELNASVTAHFSQWGTVLNVKVFRDWMQRPYGFVQFANLADAQKALREASGTVLDGRYIRCEPARVNRTIYLAQMPADASKKSLQDIAAAFGVVEDITLVKASSKLSVTINAFIRYKYREDAVKAYLALFNDPPLNASAVEWAANVNQSRDNLKELVEQNSTSTLVVKNLPPTVSQEALQCKFGQFGYVPSVAIIGRLPASKKQAGDSKGGQCYAFVRFETKEDAYRAQASENGSLMHGRTIQVTFKDNSGRSNDNAKLNRLRRPHPPGRSHPASPSRAEGFRSNKTVNGTNGINANLLKCSSTSDVVDPNAETSPKAHPKTRLRQASHIRNHNNSLAMTYLAPQHPTDMHSAPAIHQCTSGYQVPCSPMTYNYANSSDYSGMCYSLPMYQYCMDYGTGYYYSNIYSYPSSCYPMTGFPTHEGVISSKPRPKKAYSQGLNHVPAPK